ncbi:MAG TPA: ComEC/Rec2 family competence protein [Candidatus Paceibacterota bacterium]|nr:ComEC/Rec2 family competence protein [Candidatus Paceibacterota bacterium]
MRGGYFYGSVGAFAAGTAYALLGGVTLAGATLVLIVAVAAGALCLVHFRTGRFSHASCVIIIVLSAFGCGALRASFSLHQGEHDALSAHAGEHVELQAVVAEDPIVTSTNQKVVLKIEGDAGKAIAFAPLYPRFAYGDVVSARGILKKPEAFVIETSGRTFNYPAYLAKDGIRHILDKPKLMRSDGWRGSSVKRWFIGVRHAFTSAVEHTVPEPYAGLASGVVLGVDGALSKADEELFRDAGLIHVVVVSGYNITLVGDMAARLLARAPIFVASAGSLLCIVAFIMTTGASATAIRAGIMATLVLISRLTKRHYDMQRALFLAGFVMIIHTPMILLHDPSFQLSFLATWGLGALTPLTHRLFGWVTSWGGLRGIAATTLATQTAVTPLLLHMSGALSVLSLPANILVLPFIPLIMMGTLAIGILGFLPALVLTPLSIGVHGVSAYVFGVARVIDRIPMSVAHVPSVSLWVLAGIYSALLVIVWRHKKLRSYRS